MTPTNSKVTLNWSQRLTVLAMGALTSLSFAPYNFSFIPPFSLAFMLWFLYHANSKRMAAGSVFYFCIGLYGTGMNWVYLSLYNYGGASKAAAIGANAVLVIYLSLVMMAAGLLIYHCRKLRGGLWLLFAASAWMALEWFRGWFMGGLPWLSLGISQTDGLLAGYFPIIGATATSFLLLLSAGGVMFGLLDRKVPWLAVPIVIFAVGFALKPILWTTPYGDKKTIALVQGNVDQGVKWTEDAFQSSWEDYTEMSANSLLFNPDVIIWPETALPKYYHLAANVADAQRNLAETFKTDLIFGTFWNSDATTPGNALIQIDHKTGKESVYLKTHLLSFGEVIPYADIIEPLFKMLSDIPIEPMAVGEPTQPLFEFAGIKAAPFICFESAFGNELIDTTKDSHMIINVSNDGWFKGSKALDQHLQVNRARTIESRRWLARATNTGYTALVDPFGVIREMADKDVQATITGKIQPMEGITPYQRTGDMPWQILWGLCIGFGLLVGRVPKSKTTSSLN